MTVIVPVNNTHGKSTPFWPEGEQQLDVIFEGDGAMDPSNDECVVVRGVDPARSNQVVFSGTLRFSQKDAFIQAILDGCQGELVSNENGAETPDDDVVVITDPGPGGGPGPRFRVTLSGTGA